MWRGTVSSFCVYFILRVGEVSYSATRQRWHEIAHIKNKVTQGFQPGPKSCVWPFRPVQAAVRLARKAALLHQPCTSQYSAVFWRVRIQNWLHRPWAAVRAFICFLVSPFGCLFIPFWFFPPRPSYQEPQLRHLSYPLMRHFLLLGLSPPPSSHPSGST